MFAKLCAKRNKKGFTLAELLIVIAIIAVLVAIAIPVYTAQLEKAKESVKAANERSASFMAVADANLKDGSPEGTYYYTVDEKYNMTPAASKPSSGPYVEVKIDKDGKVTSSIYTPKS